MVSLQTYFIKYFGISTHFGKIAFKSLGTLKTALGLDVASLVETTALVVQRHLSYTSVHQFRSRIVLFIISCSNLILQYVGTLSNPVYN